MYARNIIVAYIIVFIGIRRHGKNMYCINIKLCVTLSIVCATLRYITATIKSENLREFNTKALSEDYSSRWTVKEVYYD